MAYEHIGPSDPRPAEAGLQFGTDFAGIAWVRTRITPAHSGSVISANPRPDYFCGTFLWLALDPVTPIEKTGVRLEAVMN
jgi:hypothetical protein